MTRLAREYPYLPQRTPAHFSGEFLPRFHEMSANLPDFEVDSTAPAFSGSNSGKLARPRPCLVLRRCL